MSTPKRSVAPASAFPGTPRFEVRRVLGEGGMGIVYEAFARDRNMPVALKTLRSVDAQSIFGLKTERVGYFAEDLTDHHHHHLVCTECGSISDVTVPDPLEAAVEALAAEVAGSAGFVVERHRLDLVGRCAACH